MPWSVICAGLWLVAANVRAIFPSRDRHWRFAYVMIAIGIPLLGWVTLEAGPIVALLFMAGGASVLRWPIFHAWRRLRGRRDGEPAE
ncbi:DUF2484 family protein [Salipiger sp. IMCC34102]|uniref:DUF2484 family protein n=1 Tax=Salipiger sp. IMCC34102 TaxID=2510647 RepID=UPI00101DFBCB|nr:DUF2484 family protein [Salipiger sp. IMCC34102]RYH02686.1 DUF2484 family protein [Salipiger sp. IMCC34102]